MGACDRLGLLMTRLGHWPIWFVVKSGNQIAKAFSISKLQSS
jgi:hypothetical protein